MIQPSHKAAVDEAQSSNSANVGPHKHFYVAIVILIVASASNWAYLRSVAADVAANETVPLRESLTTIPLTMGNWIGRSGTMRPDVEMKLGTKDWLLRSYRAKGASVE